MNCKQTFTSDIRKGGYLKIGRSQLKTLFTGDQEQRQLANILLCVQTFAYFSEGQVCTKDGSYICRPGEWITSYTEIGDLVGLERHLIKIRLMKLEQLHMLTVEDMDSYRRIRLTNYDQQTPMNPDRSVTPPPLAPREPRTGSSLFAGASAFYAAEKQQKGEMN